MPGSIAVHGPSAVWAYGGVVVFAAAVAFTQVVAVDCPGPGGVARSHDHIQAWSIRDTRSQGFRGAANHAVAVYWARALARRQVPVMRARWHA